MSEANTSLVPQQRIEQCLLFVRGHTVMVDADLAVLYGVTTKALNQAVKRNPDRFPPDFMFVLTNQEVAILKSQFVTSRSWGGRRKPTSVFTEQGVAMLSSVLKSKRAALVNVQIMRTFVKLRALLASHDDLRRKVLQLEGKYDRQFKIVFETIQQMLAPPKKPAKIGFTPPR